MSFTQIIFQFIPKLYWPNKMRLSKRLFSQSILVIGPVCGEQQEWQNKMQTFPLVHQIEYFDILHSHLKQQINSSCSWPQKTKQNRQIFKDDSQFKTSKVKCSRFFTTSILLLYKFYFRIMNGKQGVIRLGRSKSLKGRNKSIMSNEYDPSSTSNSFQSENIQQIQQKSTRNQSFQFQEKIAQGSREKILMPNQNLLNCYVPCHRPEIVKQKLGFPERNVFTKHESPIKKVMIPSQSSIVNEKEEMNNEAHLRKIIVLEERVQELHEQKQIGLVRAYEEGRKVKEEFTQAQSRFMLIENKKNEQIKELKQKVKDLQDQIVGQNVHYEGQLRMAMSTLTAKANQNLIEQNRRLQDENKQMRDQITEMEMAVVNATAAIEANNHSIIENYEYKIAKLQNQIQESKFNANNECTQEEYFDNNCKQVLDIMKKLAHKDIELAKVSNDLAEKDSQCQFYRNEWESIKRQMLESAEKILKQKQERTLREEELMTRINDLSHLSQQNEEKYNGACERILCLEQQLKSIRLASGATCQKPKVQQPCRGCQQLIKTLGKLSQKSSCDPS